VYLTAAAAYLRETADAWNDFRLRRYPFILKVRELVQVQS
jgi:hypothetical protein